MGILKKKNRRPWGLNPNFLDGMEEVWMKYLRISVMHLILTKKCKNKH